MFNLSDIMQSAQGGQAVNNLATRFGISPTQAQGAIDALLPAFQMGLQNRVADSGSVGSILSHLGNGVHQEAYADAGAAQAGTTTAQGNSVLGDLFGSHGTSTQVAQQAATESGVPAAIIQAMLPVIASIIMGGLFHSAQSGGLGGMLSQVIGAAMGGQGGLGSIFGQGAGQATAPGPAPDSGLGGMIGSVLGGLFGGQQAAPGQAPPSAMPAGSTGASTLEDLSRMFQAGTPASPQHAANLASILGR